jgi:hypothetical protein
MRVLRLLILALAAGGFGAVALFMGGTPVLADHGNQPWGFSDAGPLLGRWRFELAECSDPTSFSPAQIAIPAPWSVSTSKETAENEAQLVLWTPRVWWRTQENPPLWDHEDVGFWSSTYDWHYAWVRAGDYKDEWMVPYKDEMFTGGAAYPAWTNLRTGVTDGENFRALSNLNLSLARVYVVEEILYWQGTSVDPGWEYGSQIRAFSGSLYQPESACIPGQ